MKIKDFMQELYDWTDNDASHYEVTCDTIKAGDPEQELTRSPSPCSPPRM